MVEILREEPPDTIEAPVDAPPAPAGSHEPPPADSAPSPEPSSAEDPLDKLLAEYDQNVARTAPDTPPADALDAEHGDAQIAAELEQRQAAERLKFGEAIVESGKLRTEAEHWKNNALALQQQHQALLNQLHVAAEQQDFSEFSKQVQAKLPEHMPEDFASRWLMTEAMNDTALRIAFDTRKENPDNLRGLFFRAQDMLIRLQQSPNADPNQIAQVADFAQKCAVALDGPRILAMAKARCVEAARKNPPVDPDLTADHHMISQAVRSAGGKMPVERPPNLGQMNDREFSDYKRSLGL